MTDTIHLALPYIAAAQAQKHVTHNEALRSLDAIVMLAVDTRSLGAPPSEPEEGARYLVADPASGGFADRDGQLAHFRDGAFAFHMPRAGWIAYVADEDALVLHDGAAWRPLLGDAPALQNVGLFGLNTTADAVNPLAVRLNNALWTALHVADGGDGDLRYKLSKEASANTLSLLFQTGFSGRAEIGLAGDDNLSVKVSDDGSTWKEALVADRTDGRVRFPQGIVHPLAGAPLQSLMFTPGGDGAVSIWRMDASHAQNPRNATVSSVSGDTITLTAAVAGNGQFGRWPGMMEGVVYARIWNTSISPAQSAWVKASPSTTTLQVTDAAHIAGWANGDIVQIGDPTDVTPGRVIALDISPMLQNLFGAPFRQSGIMLRAAINGGTAGDVLNVTPTGISGSNVRAATANGATISGDGVTIIPCSELSPISDSNLVFVSTTIATSATTEVLSSMAVLV